MMPQDLIITGAVVGALFGGAFGWLLGWHFGFKRGAINAIRRCLAVLRDGGLAGDLSDLVIKEIR